MNLPEEIRNKEFSISLRGYNITEVEDYIEMLLEKYDLLYNENAELSDRLSQLSARLEANSSANHRAADVIEAAKKEAAKIVANAKNATAAQSTGAGSFSDLLRIESKISEKTREYNELCKKVDEFKNSIFALYSEHISSLSTIEVTPIEEKGQKTATAEPVTTEPVITNTEDNAEDAADTEAEKTMEFSVCEAAGSISRETPRTEVIKDEAPAPKKQAEDHPFTSGFKVTREPAGSASATRSFSAVKERLKTANADTDAALTKKQKKFF